MRAMSDYLRDVAIPPRPQHGKPNPTPAIMRTCTMGLLGLALVLGAHPAAAQEDFSPSPLQSAMDLLGLSEDEPKPEINYRERSPLVVPPGGKLETLPTPQESAYKRNPAWPKDPDVARRKREAEDRNKPIIRDDPGRPLMPSELNKGRKNAGIFGIGLGNGSPSGDSSVSKRLLPSDLGFSGWLNPSSKEPVAFAGEPERENLTQPPPGYQTPAPNAPYGVVEGTKPTGLDFTNPFRTNMSD
ncbi:hypothetical protein ACT6QH_11475 [Xanthobacter sp. TB0139]|uniref:hypothetical protein n=1 Tax=Xanthobacter sp. TB0139 TaxID=3459178 RepID=UPI0040393D09